MSEDTQPQNEEEFGAAVNTYQGGTTVIDKPNPAAVRETARQRRQAAEQVRAQTLEEAGSKLTEAQEAVAEERREGLSAAASKRDEAVGAANKKVTDADAEVVRIQRLLAEAKANAKTARKDCKTLTAEAKQEFGSDSAAVLKATGEKDAEARGAYNAVKSDADATVAEVVAEGNKAVAEERADLRAYRIYGARDEIVSTVNGVINVGRTLGEAFTSGRNADAGLDVPERLQKRVKAAAPGKDGGPS